MEKNNNENFINVALNKLEKTIELFKEVDSSISLIDLLAPPQTTVTTEIITQTPTTATTEVVTR